MHGRERLVVALSEAFYYTEIMHRSMKHLNALRAFESAARHESFSKAAAELHVSHTVVGQHVRNLEEWLSAPLFVRHKNWIELTDEGRMLAPRITEGMQILADACDAFHHSSTRSVIEVVAEPAISSRWLRRLIVEFQKENPRIEINLRSAWSPPAQTAADWDIIVHFERRIPGARRATNRLFPIDGFPACSPTLFEQVSKKQQSLDIASLPLIHDHGISIWRHWFEEFEPDSKAWEVGQVHSDLSLAIDAAVDGEGIILADNIICKRELETGALIKIDDRTVRCAWYSSLLRIDRRARPDLRLFQTWLMESAAKSHDLIDLNSDDPLSNK